MSVSTEGIDRGAAVALQVERGAGWSTVGRLTATGGTVDVAVQLPRSLRPGRKRLRVTAQVGDETVTSPARALRLRKAKGWTTSGRQDGRWTGTASGLPVEFRVSGDGRTVRAGRFQLTLLCPTPGMANPFTTQIADAPLPRAKIAPDGSFVFAAVVRGPRLVHPRPDPREQGDRERPPLARPLHRQRRLHGEAPLSTSSRSKRTGRSSCA